MPSVLGFMFGHNELCSFLATRSSPVKYHPIPVNMILDLRLGCITLDGHVVVREVFTAVTMKNAVYWELKPQFVLHRRHVTSPLHSPAS
jgi:hypothetical protein